MSARRLAKRLVHLLGLLVTAPLWLACLVERALGTSEEVFSFCSQLLAPMPGSPGRFCRAAFCSVVLERCHWEVSIGYGTIFTHRGATLARNASLGAYCVVGHADLGERVMLGSRISIPSGKRQHFDDDGEFAHGAPRFERVAVGADCWIGEGAILLADVGAGSVVSAGAVVVHAVPPGSLVGGNPARVLRSLRAAATEGQ